ncbi:MAG: subfamily polymerase sigma-24 subunit [Sphingomonas bacterium]|uniref:sigma-70 region 4 domain-containing protein n=1 Tax=Sphingomonas bacterium TaxID=1895847 RepID=UPI00261F9EA6|nr:sigma-70 region 4 domain-containing protein [Sphingomonas bacterium]MDB5708244.1 subfamily polymerase sigma-24 subunit [Sphingomonas bacterium]
MADAPDHDAATLVAIETAIEALPPLTRVVFLLIRVNDLSYGAIARRLSIGALAVESGLADALYRLCCTLDGETVERAMSAPLADANTILSGRYRCYCESRLHALGVTCPIPWDDDDDGATVMRATLLTMPPTVLETFILNRVEDLTCAQIAKRMGTFRWIARWRMLRGIRHVAQRPMSFEQWLRDI